MSGRLSVLFWFLVASIALPVVVPDGPIIRVAMGVALFVLMLSGLHAISSHRRVLHVGIALAVPAVAVNLLGLATSDLILYTVSQFLYLAFFVYLAFQILRWTLSQEDVDKETIYGAVSVYLLMALIWGIAYYSIALMHPGSFHFPDEDELAGVQAQRAAALEVEGELPMTADWTERANSASGTMMYYSFVTLTTLGYGDMYPVRDGSRILAMLEATLGQLYLVILVARLVGLYTAQQMEERKKAPPT
jgi:hypothetical protein